MIKLSPRSSEDLLAVVPVVLGFVPTDSVVMLTFGADEPFHARLNLPPPGASEELAAVVDSLLAPARRQGVARVVLVLFSDLAGWCDEVAGALVGAFVRAEIDVVDALRADGQRWFPLGPGPDPAGGAGTPYELESHRFTAQAVLEGRVTLASREELAASLRGGPRETTGIVDALAELGDAPLLGPDEVRRLVDAHLGSEARLADLDAARLLRSLGDLPARDAAWCAMTRPSAQQHVALWTDLTRRSPDALLAGAASLLGFAAWLAGHGALAWCAIDRCHEVDPDHHLAALLARLLEAAVPPSEWVEWPQGQPGREGSQGTGPGREGHRSLRPSG